MPQNFFFYHLTRIGEYFFCNRELSDSYVARNMLVEKKNIFDFFKQRLYQLFLVWDDKFLMEEKRREEDREGEKRQGGKEWEREKGRKKEKEEVLGKRLSKESHHLFPQQNLPFGILGPFFKNCNSISFTYILHIFLYF
jgi:hypothetical protein